MVMRDERGRFTSERALPREFPRDHPGNPNQPPEGSVGPNVDEGFGDTHVMYPAGMPVPEAWQGWPVTWGTQWSNVAAGDYRAFQKRLDVVYACLDKNAGPLSTMPVYVQKNGHTFPENFRSWLANPEPLVYTSWVEFAKQLFWLYQAAGEVFVVATARYADGYPQRFVAIEPWLVTVDRVNGRKTYKIGESDIDPDDVVHIKYLSFGSNLRGCGPLEAAGLRLLAAEAIMRYSTDVAVNGGAPWAVLKHARQLTTAQTQKLKQQWLEGRMNRSAAPAVLDGDTDIEVLSTSPRDMMLQEMSAYTESRLAVLLGVPPHLVGLPSGGDSLTYSTVSMMYDAHWRGTLRVMSRSVMSALDPWLVPSGVHIEQNEDDYVQPGWLERAQTYEILLRNNVVTPGQVAERERWLAPIGKDLPLAATQAAPTPTPLPADPGPE